MTHFTIEEMNLISIYPSATRALLIEILTDSLTYMDDDDMIHLAVRVIDKLTRMTNAEYDEETGDTPQAVYAMLCEQLLINAKKVPKLEQQYVKSFLKRMPEIGKMIRHQQNQK